MPLRSVRSDLIHRSGNVGVKGRQFGSTTYDKAPALGLRRYGISFPPVLSPSEASPQTEEACILLSHSGGLGSLSNACQ